MRSLGGRNLHPQRGGMAERCAERPMCLPGVSTKRMVGVQAAAKLPCIGGFRPGLSWRWKSL